MLLFMVSLLYVLAATLVNIRDPVLRRFHIPITMKWLEQSMRLRLVSMNLLRQIYLFFLRLELLQLPVHTGKRSI